MLCSNCGKREVEVLIKQVVNQEVHNLNLCRACAEELGFIARDLPSITISFSLNEVDTQKQKKVRKLNPKKQERSNDHLFCPACATAYKTFQETGLLGCPDCYEAFRFPLGAFLQKEQGAESHWGGKSEMFSDIEIVESFQCANSADKRKNEQDTLIKLIKRLQSELDEAISREEFERAAELRDSLRPLLSQIQDEKNDN